MAHYLPDWLIQQDLEVWKAVHVEGRSAFLDAVIPFVRNENFWAPLYIFLLVYAILNFKKSGLIWCLFFFAAFGCSDYVNSSILKPLFDRLRPCNTPELQSMMYVLVPCGGGKSFPSSHAANHFAMAVFSAITFYKHARYAWIPFLLWALLVSYAQVYVGVHFPLDVLGGAIVGSFFGALFALLFGIWFRLRKKSPSAMAAPAETVPTG